ncbi:hypothetical protein HWV62_42436 [Athelia sp. TMB]|nr:hypothetical protein HWV62_42436 [Athelia sp. TMB]
MTPSFRRAYPSALLRSEFSVELAPLQSITGSCSLRRSFSSEAEADETLEVDLSPTVPTTRDEEALTPKELPAHIGSEDIPLAPALKRRSSRTYAQASAVRFLIPKPDGEQGRATTEGSKGKKGYVLKELLTKSGAPHTLNWTLQEYDEAQKFIDSLIVKYLNVDVSRTKQESVCLEALRAEVVKTYPIVDQGERDWIFNDFVTAGLKKEKEKRKRKRKTGV